MIPVDQTILSTEDGTIHGNCFRACIASILHIDIDDIPKFESMASGEWHIPFFNFLNANGYEFMGTGKPKGIYDGYIIAFGDSHRKYVTHGHSVIYKDGKMVHDPHPSRSGLKKLKGFYMIEKIKPTIGIDLDSTLIKMEAVRIASGDLGYEFTDKHSVDWNHNNFPDDLRKRIFELFNDPIHMCQNATPIEGAADKVRSWSLTGHKVVLITARPEPIRKATIEMVNNFFPSITNIRFVGFNESKVGVLRDEGVSIWVDDAPHGVEDSLRMGIRTFIISNNYTKYNWAVRDRLLIEFPEKLTSVKLVSEINLE